MVIVQRKPQDTGKEHLRTVENALSPSFSFFVLFRDSPFPFPSPLLFYISYSKYAPTIPSKFVPCKGNHRLSQIPIERNTDKNIFSLLFSGYQNHRITVSPLSFCLHLVTRLLHNLKNQKFFEEATNQYVFRKIPLFYLCKTLSK